MADRRPKDSSQELTISRTALRKHPFVRTYGGKTNWPPVWTPVQRIPVPILLTGEIGTLQLARYWIGVPNRCHLFIEYENQRYIGTLLFEDAAFCWTLTAFLKKHTGRSIREIGDLDLPSSGALATHF